MKKIKESNNTLIIISIVLAIILVCSVVYFSGKGSSVSGKEEASVNNVTIVDGKQIIEIKAKGGYTPIHSTGKAGMPTMLRVDTNGTFDCSSSVRIPSMNISQRLPMSSTTDIDIGTQPLGLFQGTCGMGMYPFDIKFE